MTLSKFFDVLDLVLTSATCFCLNQLKLFVFLFQKMKPNLRGSIKKFKPLCQKSYWSLYFLFKLFFLPLHYPPCYHLIQLFFCLVDWFCSCFCCRYSWTICQCQVCECHMGWKFKATNRKLHPQKFWGLSRYSFN